MEEELRSFTRGKHKNKPYPSYEYLPDFAGCFPHVLRLLFRIVNVGSPDQHHYFSGKTIIFQSTWQRIWNYPFSILAVNDTDFLECRVLASKLLVDFFINRTSLDALIGPDSTHNLFGCLAFVSIASVKTKKVGNIIGKVAV